MFIDFSIKKLVFGLVFFHPNLLSRSKALERPVLNFYPWAQRLERVKLEVVLADLGMAEMVCDYSRKLRDRAKTAVEGPQISVPICTLTYRAPDVLLGSVRFGADLDVWSLGCVAAELFLRKPLFQVKGENLHSRDILDAQFEFLGTPPSSTSTYSWMKSLPFFTKFYGRDAQHLVAKASPSWPPECLRGCPPQLADLVQQTLQWHPQARPAAASASLHSFLSSRALSATAAVGKGKYGPSSIVAGSVDGDVLEYLQNCPTLAQLAQWPNCIHRSVMQREIVGYIDANNPPKCKSLNSNENLDFIGCERLALFVKAFRRRAKAWLHQLTARVRAEIHRQHLPSEFLQEHGISFMEEDFADNAFVYASVQFMKIGKREDGWHTDGGASLLHASLTLFGSRTVQVKLEDEGCISLPQWPGSFYVGNMCAMEHNVAHGDHAAGCFAKYSNAAQSQIAVMLRTDVFRGVRARKINAAPWPWELYRIVNTETAKHLADEPLHLPDLAAVIAEQHHSGNESAPYMKA